MCQVIPEPGIGYLRTPEDCEPDSECKFCGNLDHSSTLAQYDGKCEQCWNFCCRECGAFLHHSRGLMLDMRKCQRCGALYLWDHTLESWGMPVDFSEDIPVKSANAVIQFVAGESIGTCRDCNSWYVIGDNDSGSCGICELNRLGIESITSILTPHSSDVLFNPAQEMRR